MQVNKKKLVIRNFFFLTFLLLAITIKANPPILDKKLSLNIENKTIEQILNELEIIADVTFSYNSDIINNNKKLTVQYSNRSLKEILFYLLQEEKITFAQIGKQIILFPANETVRELYYEDFIELNIPTYAASKSENITKKIRQEVIKVYDTITVYDTVSIEKEIVIKHHDTVTTTKAITPKTIEFDIGAFFIPTPVKYSKENASITNTKSVEFGIKSVLQKFGRWSLLSGISYSIQWTEVAYNETNIQIDSVAIKNDTTRLDTIGEYWVDPTPKNVYNKLDELNNERDDLIKKLDSLFRISYFHDVRWQIFKTQEDIKENEFDISYYESQIKDPYKVVEYKLVPVELPPTYTYFDNSATYDFKSTITTHYLIVPIELRYRIVDKKHFTLDLSSAANFNILLFAKGSVLEQKDGSFYHKTDISEVLHPITISGQISTLFAYKIKNSSVYVKPYYRFNLNKEKIYTQNQEFYGLQFGYQYDFQ